MSSFDQTTPLRLSVMRRGSIRGRILVLAVLATLLPSLTTAWLSYLENKSAVTAKVSEELHNASTQASRELELWVKERRYELRVFASSYEVTENLERTAPAARARSDRALQHLNDYLTSVHERFAGYDELMIVDTHGDVVASSAERLDDTIVLPADWQPRMRGDNMVLGAPYWDSARARPAMLIAVPIGVAGGKFLGALAAKVDLTPLGTTLKRFAPDGSSQVCLVTPDGAPIVSSRESSAALMALHLPPGTIRTQLALEGRTAQFQSLRGDQVIGSLRRVPGLDWMVVAEIRSADVFRQLTRHRNVNLLVVLAMLAVAGSVGYALGLFIVRPLNRLTRGVAKVASGDLDVDLPGPPDGEVGYLTQVFNEMVARLRASRSELERLSVTDPLTGVYNRRRMTEALENEVRRSRRLGHPFAVLMIDVDHFKQFNDAHGHPAGDEVLKRIADLLREATRDLDFVARYGGEEFFVLMPEMRVDGAAAVAQRVRQRLAVQPAPYGAITLSFGVAEFPRDGDSGDALVAVADGALYQAKREGRDQVVVARIIERSRSAG